MRNAGERARVGPRRPRHPGGSRRPGPGLLRRELLGVGALICLLLLLAHELVPLSGQVNSDLYTYLQAAQAVRHGHDPFAPVAQWIAHYHGGGLLADYYVYAPLFALLLTPLSWLPFDLAVVIWGVANLIFLAGALRCLLLALGRRPPLWLLSALTLAAALLSPVRMELQWGQADILLLFLLSASFLAARTGPPARAGTLLAVAMVIKPPLGLLLVFFAWKREWRLVGIAILAGLLLFLAPFLIVGRQALADQFTLWQFWSNHYTPFIDNIAPKGVLARLFTRNPNGPGLIDRPALAAGLWAVTASGALALALFATGRRQVRDSLSGAAWFGLAICAVLVASPLTEWIYLTLLVIPLVVCAAPLTPAAPVPGWADPARRTPLAAPSMPDAPSWWPAGEPYLHDGSDRQHSEAPGRRSALPPHASGAPAARQWFVRSGLAAVYLALCAPLNHIEYWAWPRMAAGGLRGAGAVLVAAVYLYPLVALFALCLALTSRGTGSRPAALRADVDLARDRRDLQAVQSARP